MQVKRATSAQTLGNEIGWGLFKRIESVPESWDFSKILADLYKKFHRCGNIL